MNKTNLVDFVLEQYRKGQRHFENLDMENESFEGQNLEDIVFEDCSLYISFRKANLKNAKFINGGIKTCDFREADLTNARFEYVCIESAKFARAKTIGIYFNNNSCYGQNVTQSDFDEWIKDWEE
jgi:uncharacterized protein YjbI with pentapeptide repeats